MYIDSLQTHIDRSLGYGFVPNLHGFNSYAIDSYTLYDYMDAM